MARKKKQITRVTSRFVAGAAIPLHLPGTIYIYLQDGRSLKISVYDTQNDGLHALGSEWPTSPIPSETTHLRYGTMPTEQEITFNG